MRFLCPLIGSSDKADVLTLSFEYLVKSIDTSSILPAALSSNLITVFQKSECSSEPDAYKKADLFLSHLQRAVNGDPKHFYVFLDILERTRQTDIALNLRGEHHGQ